MKQISAPTEDKFYPDIIADEFGDPANNPKLSKNGQYEPSRVFGYAALEPTDPLNFFRIHVELEQFEDISKALQSKKVHEIKTADIPTEHIDWFCDQLHKCARSYAYYVDKLGDLPQGWKQYDTRERMLALLLFSIEDLVKRIEKFDIVIIFDLHNLYDVDWVKSTIVDSFISISQKYRKNILLTFEKSSSGSYLHEIQSADAIAYGTLRMAEHEDGSIVDRTHTSVKKLNSSDTIIRKEI